jgi:amidohydrolase
LPICERNDVPHRSRYDGRMHACGHDGHTAMLLGAVRGLAADRGFDGTVVAIFQAGEEGHAGAKVMVEDGLFDRFPVSAVYALHNWPSLARGEVAVMAGPMMAARDDFSVRLSGTGGHGAQPHLCSDPVVAAAHFISAAQSIVSRNVDPSETAVVTIHSVHAGNPVTFGAPSSSVTIPERVELAGVAKWLRPFTGDLIARRLSEIARSTADGLGVSVEIDYQNFLPVTANGRQHADLVAAAAERVIGPDRVSRAFPASMGSEDFSFMLGERPGAYFFLGAGTDVPSLHSATYDFNDEIIPIGTNTLIHIARAALSYNNHETAEDD